MSNVSRYCVSSLRLASLALALPHGCVRIRLTTVVGCVACISDLWRTNALLKVTGLIQLACRWVDISTLGKRDVAVVACTRSRRAYCDGSTRELVDGGLVDA